MLKIVSTAVVMGLLFVGSAYAQDANRAPPPDGKKLSEIVSKVEQRDGFRYISDVDWDDGAYEVTYYTTDKAKVEIRFDAVTGEPK
jgi:hypothetical protein